MKVRGLSRSSTTVVFKKCDTVTRKRTVGRVKLKQETWKEGKGTPRKTVKKIKDWLPSLIKTDYLDASF